jgi:PIN domain nuclease of toxin-antitoxin system
MLLDTCAFIWLLQGGNLFPPQVRSYVYGGNAALYLSAVSAAEIGIKQAKGDIQISRSEVSDHWLVDACRDLGVGLIDVDVHVCWQSTQLPWHHRDPFDRLIIATAMSRRLTVITPDHRIHGYQEIECLWK